MTGWRLLVLPLLLLSLAGCRVHHYLVLEDGAPLYAAPAGGPALAHLPRYHHEPLDEEPEQEDGRVRVTYRGRDGYVPRAAVSLFSYLAPGVDGGQDRDEAIAEQLREAQLAELGRDWPPEVVQAIREQRVHAGMTRRQVELAWGWPLTVAPGPEAGTERWVYQRHSYTTVQGFLADGWGYPSSFSLYVDPWCAGYYARHRWWRDGWTQLRLPITEERVVEIGADGRVTSVQERRFLRDA